MTKARRLNWERISNGELLTLAEGSGFELIVTTDKNVRYQQNLVGRQISIGGWSVSILSKSLQPLTSRRPAALPMSISRFGRWLSAESGCARIDLVKPAALPGPSMRRTPPGGPPVAVAFADADEPLASWLRRLLLRIRSAFQPKKR